MMKKYAMYMIKIRDVEYHAKKEGLAEGHANMLNSAKKMLKDDLDIKTIMKYTGLSKEEIENIH